MCGIAGIVDRSGQAAGGSVIARMLAVLHHRGPDDEGTYFSDAVTFGFRRLSILDLSPAGHQPMSAPADGMQDAVTIVFNGEIYNFVELKRDLEARGHAFRSTGDTEVLLHSYLEWGEDCVSRLNGMWAFVIHDRRRKVLFGSRDRFGIKPLFLHHANGRFLFASEIKAIRASGLYKDELNHVTVSSFLVDGRLDETPETFYAGIRQLPPGFSFTYDVRTDQLGERRYWDIRAAQKQVDGDIPARFADLFEDAVRLHMRSDVPVGIHLSGGLDSTAIACASARVRRAAGAGEPLKVFSYISPEFDESVYIRATAAQTGAQLIELQTSADKLWADLERLLWFQDEPVHTLTALVSFQLMRATAGHGIKVVLNGQGADETLAGYPSYFDNYWYGLVRTRGIAAALTEMKVFGRAHGAAPAGLLLRQLSKRVMRALSAFAPYRAYTAQRRMKRARNGWFSDGLVAELPKRPPMTPADLDGALLHSQTVSPLPLYLRLEDRNAMAHSIEARLPFLDYRLAELAYSLPDDWKLRGAWNKFVLREAMTGRIPETVRKRADKMGFPVPAQQWFADQLSEPIMDLLGSRRAVESGCYRMDIVRNDIERHRKGEINIADELFAVAQFELLTASMERGTATLKASHQDFSLRNETAVTGTIN